MENITNNNLLIESEQQPKGQVSSSRVYGGTIRSVGGGEVELMQTISTNTINSNRSSSPEGSVLSTAMNSNGSPTGHLSSNSTVELIPGNPASRTSIEVAVQMGYLKKDVNGNYMESDGIKNEQPLEPNKSLGVELFNQNTEAAYNQAISEIPSGVLDVAMMKAAHQVAVTGEVSDKIAVDAAHAAGIPPEVILSAQKVGMDAFQAQADSAIKALGADPQEFYEWCRENHPEQLAESIRLQLLGRTTKGYKELAKKYMTSTVPNIQVIEKAGHKVRKTHNANLINYQGMEIDIKTAARMGLI